MNARQTNAKRPRFSWPIGAKQTLAPSETHQMAIMVGSTEPKGKGAKATVE
jgi:hypothetical protein